MAESARDGIEALDAVARGDVELAARRIERERLRQAVAVAVKDVQGGRVELEELAAAARRPQAARLVVGEVKHRLVELRHRRERAPAVLVESVQRAAVAAAARDERAVGPRQQGERADVRVALDDAGAEGGAAERRDDEIELGGMHRHRARYARLRLGEERIGRRAAARLGRLADVLRRAAHRGRDADRRARAVVGHRLGDARLLAIAGVVGRQREEFVAVPGVALVHRRGRGRLALPDLPVATVLGHIHRGVLHARAAGLVGRAPTHVVVGAAGSDEVRAHRGGRRRGVQRAHDLGGVDRRLGIEDDARRFPKGRAGGRIERRLRGEAHITGAVPGSVVRRKQAARGIGHDFAGLGVDRLQHPARGMARGINAGAHAQHEALRIAQVELALEARAIGRHMHRDVADLEVAQAEGPVAQVLVELGDDAHLVGVRARARGILEADRVGQGGIRGHVPRGADALRAGHRGRGAAARGAVEQRLQVERLDVARGGDRSVVRHLARRREAHPRREDIEGLEVRRVAQAEVVLPEGRQRGNRHVVLGALVAHAHVVTGDRRHGARLVAVPLVHLGEERAQARRALDLPARRPDEHATREHAERADHLRIEADGRRDILRPQQAALLERGEVGEPPRLGVGREVDERRVGARIGDGRGAQPLRLRALARDELGTRHRRRRGEHVEAERDVERLAVVEDLLVGIGEERPEVRVQAVEGVVLVLRGEVWPRVVDRALERREVARAELLQAGVGQRGEAHADEAARGQVERVPRREHEAAGVDLGVEAGPRHVRALAVGRAAHVGIEADERQVEDLAVVADVGRAELEVHVRRIDVGQALQRDAVEARLPRRHHARPAQADGGVDLHRALDEIPVRHDRLVAVRVDHLDVVEAVLRVAEIEGGDDARRIDHLVARGLEFGDPGAHQLHQRVGLEARAADGEGHPAAVAALIFLHVGDLEGQRLRDEPYRDVVARARAALHQHVVVAGLRGGNERLLVRGDRVLGGGVEGEAARQRVVAHVELVLRVVLRRIEAHAQRLVGADLDTVELQLSRRERRVERHAQMQLGDADIHRVGRGGEIVALVDAFVDVVEDVGAHDDAVLAGFRRRQLRLHRG